MADLRGRVIDPAMPLTVVVVDDDLDYRHIVRYLLASVSDTMVIVGEAADGEEALAVALRERPDIVITDLVMPRLNGVELTRRLRQELPLTKVILMSSYTEDALLRDVVDGRIVPRDGGFCEDSEF